MAMSRVLRVSLFAAFVFGGMADRAANLLRRRHRWLCRRLWLSAPGLVCPSVHIVSASSAPASRGSRCVPPARGMMPSSTSAGRPWRPSPPRGNDTTSRLPSAAERVAVNRRDGVGLPSAGAAHACRRIASFESSRVLMDVEHLDVRTRDERRAGADAVASACGSALARATASSMAVQTGGLSALTGGLSMVRTATRSLME